jgi:hypothetical protein
VVCGGRRRRPNHHIPPFGWHDTFDTQLVIAIAKGPIEQADDLEVAQEFANLLKEELVKFSGTRWPLSKPRINDREIAQALKALRAVLQRLEIAFDPPVDRHADGTTLSRV